MSESTVDDKWEEYWSSNGTFSFEYDNGRTSRDLAVQERLAVVHKGQNRLLRKVAEAVDEAFPPEEYGHGHGTGNVAPGDIVRSFLVPPQSTAPPGHR